MNDISIWNMLKNINNSSLPQTKWSLSTRYPNHLLNIWIRVQKPLHVFQGLWHLPSAVCLFDGPKNHGKSLLQKFGEKKAVWKKLTPPFEKPTNAMQTLLWDFGDLQLVLVLPWWSVVTAESKKCIPCIMMLVSSRPFESFTFRQREILFPPQ